MDNIKINDLITNGQFFEAETYLQEHKYHNTRNVEWWVFLGDALRGQSKINEAYAAFRTASELPDAGMNVFYSIGRLEGENVSFHRAADIKKAKNMSVLSRENIVYSCFGEQQIIATLVDELSAVVKVCVDIGAGDGLTFSNTYPLLEKGWKGVCVEPKSKSFHELAFAVKDMDAKLCNDFITPNNVLTLLDLFKVPKDFGFLSLDIDSYDYAVLEQILTNYHPSIICAEINEYYLPPVCFARHYSEHFEPTALMAIGQSISMIELLFKKNGYSIVTLEYNNVFAVKDELLHHLHSFKAKSAEDAYKEGYLNRKDTLLKCNWSYNDTQKLRRCPKNDLLHTYQVLLNNANVSTNEYTLTTGMG